MTRDFIKALAEANGLRISDDRLDSVLREYQGFMRALEEINALPLAREAEPAIVFTHATPTITAPARGEER